MRIMFPTTLLSLILFTACNEAPEAPTIALGPDPALTTDTLAVSFTSPTVDPDGDEVTHTYAWSVDGTPVADISGAEVAPEFTTKGQVWSVTVTPSDALFTGESSTASITIGNSVPTMEYASLSTSELRENDTVYCLGNGYRDADADEDVIVVEWLVNGTSMSTDRELTGANFNKGDTVQCIRTPSDGEAEGTAVESETITVLNSSPSRPGTGVAPGFPFTGDELTCAINAESNDADGDSVSYAITWTVDGAPYSGTTGTHDGDTIPASVTMPGESWECIATASDGTASTAANPSSVTVRAPVIGIQSSQEGSRFGYAVGNIGDVDGDGIDDIAVGAPLLSESADLTGEVSIYLGKNLGTAESLSDASADYTILGSEGTAFGAAIDAIGDLDGDGKGDFIIGAPHFVSSSGRAYIFLGASIDGATDLSIADADYILEGEHDNDLAGLSVAAAGDVDGDGKTDILVGAPGYDDDYPSAIVPTGRAYLVLAKSLAKDEVQSLASADYVFSGDGDAELGWYVDGVGDVDGNGKSDVLIGAPGGTTSGSALLFLGESLDTTSELASSSADYQFTAESVADRAGERVAGVGDVDGDGQDDFLIGAPENAALGNDAGRTYLFYGSSLGMETSVALADADVVFTGDSPNSFSGYAISAAGDVDADGLADLWIGAPDQPSGVPNAGKVCLFLGKDLTSGTDKTLAEANYTFVGPLEENFAGYSVAATGDLDGDGTSDVVVGAPGTDTTYVLFGGAFGF